MKKNKKTGIIILSACLLVLIAGIAAVAIAKARLIDDKHIVSGASKRCGHRWSYERTGIKKG